MCLFCQAPGAFSLCPTPQFVPPWGLPVPLDTPGSTNHPALTRSPLHFKSHHFPLSYLLPALPVLEGRGCLIKPGCNWQLFRLCLQCQGLGQELQCPTVHWGGMC